MVGGKAMTRGFFLLEMLIGSTGRLRTGVAHYVLSGLSVLDEHGGPRIQQRMRGPPHHSPRATACIRREASRGARSPRAAREAGPPWEGRPQAA